METTRWIRQEYNVQNLPVKMDMNTMKRAPRRERSKKILYSGEILSFEKTDKDKKIHLLFIERGQVLYIGPSLRPIHLEHCPIFVLRSFDWLNEMGTFFRCVKRSLQLK